MGKFVYIYYASPNSNGGSNEEWGKWFEELGDTLIDPGNPFDDDATAVNRVGTMPVNQPAATGYSIVKADSKEAALKLAKGCPLLSDEDNAVCVYEALPM